MSQQPGVAAPVAPSERIALLDILRGTALLGILLVNHNKLAAPPAGGPDRAMALAVDFCCDGSFYPLFSFLFGFGFALQISRLETRGVGADRIYLRRLAALLVIGTLHAVFLASGEVLRYYAILGVPLLLIRRLPSWVLVIGVVLCLLLTLKLDRVNALFRRMPAIAVWATPDRAPQTTSIRELEHAELRAQETGYGDLVRVRTRILWEEMRRFHLIPMYTIIFAMFLVGLLTYRSGVLFHPLHHVTLLRSGLVAGLVSGVVGSFIYVFGPITESHGLHLIPQRILDFRGVFELIGNLGLSLFYASAVTLLVSRHERWRRGLAPIGQVGRMALTNFLMQSLVMQLLLGSVGLGLAFKLGLAALLLVKLALFAGQIGLSTWWMRRFRFGPAEWLWRAATYGSLPPLILPEFSRRAEG